ncbi:MAG: aminotransferase class V-fold PLP-dependent enzyme [Atribacterota bacterium]|nr:aminotransferase class V-fold PLP-dependent enzyme [Atribacterota bacterium]
MLKDGDIYQELGVKKLINAMGTVTKIGGSLMSEEVLNAMKYAGRAFVDINELEEKVGKKIGSLLGVESALITSGAAAGMVVVAAACMTGNNPAKIYQLPDTYNMKNEIIIHKFHRVPYDQAIRATGAKLIEIGSLKGAYSWELQSAISERTAAAFYMACEEKKFTSMPLEEFIKVSHEKNIPVIVDAAAELPPRENLTRFINMGADIVIFSGGKDLRGPQASGLVIGKREIIKSAVLNYNPNFSIGRSMKVGKEEIIGLLVALEMYLKEDVKERIKLWDAKVEFIFSKINTLKGIKVEKIVNYAIGGRPDCVPRLLISIDEQQLGISSVEVVEQLKEEEPHIVVYVSKDRLIISPQMLNEGEEAIVADRLIKILDIKQ